MAQKDRFRSNTNVEDRLAWIKLPHPQDVVVVVTVLLVRDELAVRLLERDKVLFLLERVDCTQPGETPLFFEFSLCLSRACLGKMIIFSIKWRKKVAFSYRWCASLASISANLPTQPHNV